MHFKATDTIGSYAFCLRGDCECFMDGRYDEELNDS